MHLRDPSSESKDSSVHHEERRMQLWGVGGTSTKKKDSSAFSDDRNKLQATQAEKSQATPLPQGMLIACSHKPTQLHTVDQVALGKLATTTNV